MPKVVELATEAVQTIIDAYNTNAKTLITPVYHVKGNWGDFGGAKGDGVTDDTAAIQAAIDAANTAGGGVVFFPKPSSYYKVSGKIRLYSNITLLGKKYSYIYNDTTVAEPIFEVVGAPDSRISNVTIKGLMIRNGAASTGDYTAGKDGIVVKYCDGFKLEDCYITEIQGAFGLSTRYSTNIKVVNNVFYRCTYSQFHVLPECENIIVESNIFDTCTSTTAANTYLFATGGDQNPVDGWSCKNVWIRKNKFLNNPRWEGIDSHGCENLWIENNYIENVKVGMMVGLNLGYVSNPVMKNIFIRGNIIKQGAASNVTYGIVTQGAYDASGFIPAEKVVIEDNVIDGFGSTANTIGVITISTCKDVRIEQNEIYNFTGTAIMPYYANTQVKIRGNEIKNPLAADTGGNILGIRLRSSGNYYITIDRNRIFSNDASKLFTFGIGADNNYIHCQILNNYVMANTKYYNISYLPVSKSASPSGIFGVQTDVATDTNDKVTYACTNLVMCFDSTKSSGITVNGTAGSNELTIASGDFRNVCEGLEVVIAGAGDAGANLTSTIVKVTNTKIWLKDNVLTTVSGATLSYTSATWVAI